MATIKIFELEQAKNSVETLKTYKLNTTQWYWLGRISQFLNNEITAFDEANMELYKKYGQYIEVESYLFTTQNLNIFIDHIRSDVNKINELEKYAKKHIGNNIYITPENMKDFNKEQKQLFEQDIQIPIKPLKISILEGIEGLTGVSSSLMVFFEEPSD